MNADTEIYLIWFLFITIIIMILTFFFLLLVKVGDRVAQLIVETIVTPEVTVVEELDTTVRGAGGFGSTGGFAN